MTPHDTALRIELGDEVVDLFDRIDRPAPTPAVDLTDLTSERRPRNRRPRKHRTVAILGLSALGLFGAGCVRPIDAPVQIGKPLSVVDKTIDTWPAPEVIVGCQTPDQYPFTYYGPAASEPEQCKAVVE